MTCAARACTDLQCRLPSAALAPGNHFFTSEHFTLRGHAAASNTLVRSLHDHCDSLLPASRAEENETNRKPKKATSSTPRRHQGGQGNQRSATTSAQGSSAQVPTPAPRPVHDGNHPATLGGVPSCYHSRMGSSITERVTYSMAVNGNNCSYRSAIEMPPAQELRPTQ